MFNLYNFNFGLTVYFLNILVPKLEREERKSTKNGKGKRKLPVHHNLITKRTDLGVNEFYLKRGGQIEVF